MKLHKCKYCKRSQKEVILILDFVKNVDYKLICLECLLSEDAQKYNLNKKEVNNLIGFYTLK